MGLLRNTNLGTHLLIAGALLVAVVVFAVASNWSTFVVMYENLGAMNEGQRVAEQMPQPSDLLEYIAAHPEKVSLVAYEVGARDEGIFYGPDRGRPVVRVPNLLLLAEYARQVETGELAPSDRVPLDSLRMYALPGTGQSRHEQALTKWDEDDQIASDSTIALAQVVQVMVEYGDPAATDWMMIRLGRETVQELPRRWELPSSDPPVPQTGLYLQWEEDETGSHTHDGNRDSLSRTQWTDSAYRHVQALRRDSSYRNTVRNRLEREGLGLSVRDQKRLARTTYPQGTAREYADLAARMADQTVDGPQSNRTMWNHLKSDIGADSIQAPITALATQVGAMPGLISFVGMAHIDSSQAPRVSVLLFEDLPIGLFYHIVQTDLDKGLQLRLVSDPAFFERARTALSADTTSPSP